MTTTVDIDGVMFSNPVTRDLYGGTLALDEAVELLQRKRVGRRCYVVNSSPSNHVGSHWTAVWIGKNNATEHFCSYGMSPPIELHWTLGEYKKSYVQLQDAESELCGYYCMLYLMCRCRGSVWKNFSTVSLMIRR